MTNNLYKVEKDLRSIAKRYKSIKYSVGLAILFLKYIWKKVNNKQKESSSVNSPLYFIFIILIYFQNPISLYYIFFKFTRLKYTIFLFH